MLIDPPCFLARHVFAHVSFELGLACGCLQTIKHLHDEFEWIAEAIKEGVDTVPKAEPTTATEE